MEDVLSDTIWKGDHPSIILARFGLTWFNGFRGEDLKVKVYDGSQVMTKKMNAVLIFHLLFLSIVNFYQ